jgi:hypothetical protein
MDFFYTRHQTPRGAKPDKQIGDAIYLIKNVSELRLTYQIKMLAYMGYTKHKRLVIQLPKKTKIHPSLKEFIEEFSGFVRIERV